MDAVVNVPRILLGLYALHTVLLDEEEACLINWQDSALSLSS